nr:cytochrome-c peroxidase [Helicobacteraceae bacterium]
MRFFVITITIIILVIFSVSTILPKKERQLYTDDELRATALSRDLSSIPESYEELLALVDTPENRLSKQKIALG